MRGKRLRGRLKTALVLFLVGPCLAAYGCGAGGAKATVQGQVAVSGGKAASFLPVTFWPADKGKQTIDASTDSQGRFTILCVPGDYKVTVVPPSAGGAMRTGGVATPGPTRAGDPAGASAPSIPEIYWQADTTPLRVTVPKGGLTDLTLEIHGRAGK